LSHVAIEAEIQRVIDHFDVGTLQAAERVEQGFVNENWGHPRPARADAPAPANGISRSGRCVHRR